MRILILLGILASSCASDKSALQVSGLEKVVSSTSDNVVYLDDFKPQKVSRAPASRVEVPKLSNRQVYFLSFYRQYLRVSQLLEKRAEVNNCPSFHQVVLEYKGQLESDGGLNLEGNHKLTSSQDLAYYPLLAMNTSDNTSLWQELKQLEPAEVKSKIRDTLNLHHRQMKSELNQLCDSGVSPGYYVYENLVTYFKEFKDFHYTRDGLKALLKVPTLANMLLLDNLSQQSYHLTQGSVFDKWLLHRARTEWFNQYVQHINQKRTRVLKAQN